MGRVATAVLCLTGLAVVAWLAWSVLLAGSGKGGAGSANLLANDFVNFYAGAKLVGTPRLYDGPAVAEVEARAAGWSGGPLPYGHPPFHAVLLWPLGRLPYRTAFWCWESLLVAAACGSIFLWKLPGGGIKWVVACWSAPLFASLANGQEGALLLFFVAASLALLRRGKPFLAGAALALCAVKFHLFLTLPLFVVAGRRWRLGAGLLCGGGALAAVSFAFQGLNWPRSYYALMTSQAMNPRLDHMPNLHAVLHGYLWWELGFTVLAAGAVWVAVRRAPTPEWAMAAVLAGGLLVGVHGYLADMALLWPALALGVQTADARLCAPALFLALPVSALFLQADPPFPQIVLAAVACLLLGLAWTPPAAREQLAP
jgi:hypothetical protein